MIRQIVKTFEPAVSSLAWVERYGGVSTLLAHPKETNDGFKKVVYPITEAVTNANCWDGKKRYKDLVPNDGIKSILYYQQARPIVILNNGIDGSLKRSRFKCELTVVVWLNLKELGTQNHSAKHHVDADLVRVLGTVTNKKSWSLTPGMVFDETEMEDPETYVTELHSPDYTLNTVFGQYNYKNADKYYLYPYESISLSLTVEWVMKNACLDSWAPEAPLTCINLTND